MTTRHALPITVLILCGSSLCGSAAQAGPDLCPIPNAAISSRAFYALTTPTDDCPKKLEVDERIFAIVECSQGPGSATCEAWPMVYPVKPGDEEKLQYTWRVTQGGITTVYPESSNAAVTISCPRLQTTQVQVVVRNGAASDGDFIGFRCGDDPR